MQATYQLTEKDLLEAQISHAGRLFRITQILGAFSLAAGLWAVVFAEAHYYQVLVPVALGLYFLFRLHLSARLSFKRDFAGQGNVDVATSDSGVEFVSARGTGNINWSAFTRFSETKHLFILYPQSNAFHVVPKRAFSPEELPEFRRMLQQNLAEKSASHAKRSRAKFIVLLAFWLVVLILLSVVLVRSRS